MSAPNTNIETQERRHKGPLVGMAIGIAFVAVITLVYIFAFSSSQPQDGAEFVPASTEQTESFIMEDAPASDTETLSPEASAADSGIAQGSDVQIQTDAEQIEATQ
ncbi:hypothetical protein AQS8620_00986 [Aquimixticola soesokkakensis]|uniref:Uncharacterized protein n=1 Tax=Aquimixticola soesokkakensis TaxID=1519096 RepID=A0A1Y5S4D7_9RHOB|nr:hypothetical protein [Aquimixticola soesokkakensis]SLN30990.1 hypothetical protein AQS8620_00986 [Aquimixticola soesokkakensis]